eukprot:sb/3475064/
MHHKRAQAQIRPNFCVRPFGLNFGHVIWATKLPYFNGSEVRVLQKKSGRLDGVNFVINLPYLSGSEVSRGHVTKIQTKRSNAKIRTNLGLSPPVVHVGILADTCTKSGVPTPKSQNHLKGHFSPFLAFFN